MNAKIWTSITVDFLSTEQANNVFFGTQNGFILVENAQNEWTVVKSNSKNN
jgi:hypothetical protein